MSLEVKGQVCPICKAYLFDDDEIAVCPTCGAPHHRECFVNAGKCGLEKFHGTDKQYDKVKEAEQKEEPKKSEPTEKAGKKKCFSCGSYYDEEDNFCPHCGSKKQENGFGDFGSYGVKFDFLGGVNPNEDMGEGHKADDVKKFVAVSTHQMLPRFKKFKNGKRVSFSFWHLLFPSATFAMRKMYFFAAISATLEVVAALLMLPFTNSVATVMASSSKMNYVELIKKTLETGGEAAKQNVILLAVGVGLIILWNVLCSLFANRIYYKHVIKTMTDIDKTAEDEDEKILLYRKRGAINLFAFILVAMLVNMLPEIIYAFAM